MKMIATTDQNIYIYWTDMEGKSIEKKCINWPAAVAYMGNIMNYGFDHKKTLQDLKFRMISNDYQSFRTIVSVPDKDKTIRINLGWN